MNRRGLLLTTVALAAGAGFPRRLYGLFGSDGVVWEEADLYWLDIMGRSWRMDGLTAAVDVAWEAT